MEVFVTTRRIKVLYGTVTYRGWPETSRHPLASNTERARQSCCHANG